MPAERKLKTRSSILLMMVVGIAVILLFLVASPGTFDFTSGGGGREPPTPHLGVTSTTALSTSSARGGHTRPRNSGGYAEEEKKDIVDDNDDDGLKENEATTIITGKKKNTLVTDGGEVEIRDPAAPGGAGYKAGGLGEVAGGTPLLSLPSRCKTEKHLAVHLMGNRPVGTYLCSYFPNAKRIRNNGGKDSCVLACPSGVSCTIKEKATSGELQTGNIIVNHHGPVPKKYKPWQIRLYYTGESNQSEPKKSTSAYWGSYDEVISFHHTQQFHFTWTHRFIGDFNKIAIGEQPSKHFELSPTVLSWEKRIPAIAVFISRCKKGARDDFVRQLAKHYEVRSFGKCIHTHNAESIHSECPRSSKSNRYAQKMCVLSKYRFVLSMDNSREEDYVTEKVYHGLLSGGVALYDGAPNIEQYIPTMSSVIHLADFWPDLENFRTPSLPADKAVWDKGFERLATYLKGVSPKTLPGDEAGAVDSAAAVKDHFAWRHSPDTWGLAFQDRKAHQEPTCDVCTLAASKKCLYDLDGASNVHKDRLVGRGDA